LTRFQRPYSYRPWRREQRAWLLEEKRNTSSGIKVIFSFFYFSDEKLVLKWKISVDDHGIVEKNIRELHFYHT
jgi:hypothetical protein